MKDRKVRNVVVLTLLVGVALGIGLSSVKGHDSPRVNVAPQSVAPKQVCFESNIKPLDIIALTNVERQKAGLAVLTENPKLTQAAQIKGSDLTTRHYWAHHLDGESTWTPVESVGYKYTSLGENLAQEVKSASGTIRDWMNSEGHRKNMLDPRFKEVGVAVLCGVTDVNTTLVVAEYGSR